MPRMRGANVPEWEATFDGLAEFYYGRKDFYRRLYEVSVSATSGVMMVAGFPWWMPHWWPRRVVANLAMKHRLSCDVRYYVERTVMPNAK